jgi:hypothetical protein
MRPTKSTQHTLDETEQIEMEANLELEKTSKQKSEKF